MDYEAELKEVEKIGNMNWFKPKAGKYIINILTEPEAIKPFVDEKTGESKQRVSIDILVDDKKFSWTLTKGGKTSVYGQLIKIGKKVNQLKGNTITLLVTNDGKKNTYTIVEAV